LIIALLVTLTPGPATANVLRIAARDGRTVARATILGNSAGVLMWGVLSAAGVSSLILASQVAYDVLRGCGAAVLIVLGARSLLARHQARAAEQAAPAAAPPASGQLSPGQASAAEASPAQAGPAQAGPAQAGPAQAGPAQAGPAQARPAQAGPAQAVPRRRRGMAAGWRAGFITSVSNPKLAVFFIALFPQFLTRGSPVLPYALGMAAAVVVLDVLWFSALSYAVDKARRLLRPKVQRAMERVTGAVMIGLGVRLALESR
jgi:threonine/homoserine/homoserine lactone efflux protein